MSHPKKIHKIWLAFSVVNETSPQKTMHLVTTTTNLPHLLGFRDEFTGSLCPKGSSHSSGFDWNNHYILKATVYSIYSALFYEICVMTYSFTDVLDIFGAIHEWGPKKQSFIPMVIFLCLYRVPQPRTTQKAPYHRPQPPSTKNPNLKNPIQDPILKNLLEWAKKWE